MTTKDKTTNVPFLLAVSGVVVIAISRRMTDAEAHPATGDEGGKGDETE